MIGREKRVLLRHYLEQGLSTAAIARQPGISRRTVYHLIATGQLDREMDSEPVVYGPRLPILLKLDPHKPLIDARLAEYPRLTAVRLFEEARAAGYGGSYNDVKRYVRKVRPRPPNARLRIAAQLDTLRDAGVRHAVLGASGCGAFRNPATEVAAIYRQEIGRRRHDFSVVAFAIFAAGCGPSNYEPFAEVLQGACLEKPIGGWVTGPLLQAESLLQVIIDSERRGVAPPPQRRQRAYPRHLPDPLGLWGWRSVLSRSISRSLGCEPAYSAAREAKPSPRGSTPRGLEQPVSVAAPVLPRSGPSSSQRRP